MNMNNSEPKGAEKTKEQVIQIKDKRNTAAKLGANLEQLKSPKEILMNKDLKYEDLSNKKVKDFILKNRAEQNTLTDEMIENIKRCISNELIKIGYPTKNVTLYMSMDKSYIYLDNDVLIKQNKSIVGAVDIFDLKNLEKKYILKAGDTVESSGSPISPLPKGKYKIEKIDKDGLITTGGIRAISGSNLKKINQ